MLIVALVLAVIGLAALVTAVVTSNELIAWVCIGASVIGVLLLIVDAVRERSHDEDDDADEVAHGDDATTTMEPVESAEDYPDDHDPATEVTETVAVSNDKADDGVAEPTKHD
jgi:hypothetical protein